MIRRVFVHWNLHRDCYSVKDARSGRVIGYADDLVVEVAKFVVQPAGRDKTRREKRKNVHAGVRGLLSGKIGSRVGTLVTYNPYLHDSFVTRKDQPIYAAKTVVMTTIMVMRDGQLKKVPRVYARGGLEMHT